MTPKFDALKDVHGAQDPLAHRATARPTSINLLTAAFASRSVCTISIVPEPTDAVVMLSDATPPPRIPIAKPVIPSDSFLLIAMPN